MNHKLNSAPKKAFTLLELIIVIIIVGILATVGLTSYTNQTEYSRTAEAKANISSMRKLAYEYYMKSGTYIGIISSDVGVGTGADQIPNSANSKNYFYYGVSSSYPPTASYVVMYAERCSAGGKVPNLSAIYDLWWKVDSTGVATQYAYRNTTGSAVITSDWSGCCR
ncbi:MAG: prepilin-type N-terminal cleavage/methylation domain-containing protein [Candidatus Omnitrophica bacterium]|nr:prepilin-type N-terminal cleavage/methylation domain-containing protein [Candidatus Omnitrophota bacterium]